MVEGNVTIINETGLHARPASQFIGYVTKYGKAKIFLVTKDGKEANAKSILNVLALGLNKGTEITVKVDGENEQQALEEIIDFIKNLKE